LIVVSCGGGGSGGVINNPSVLVTISLSPTSVKVAAGGTQQFTATVNGSSNKAVTWQVNGQTGGGALVGTVSPSGLYTAPLSPPATGKVTLTAVAQAELSKTASATLTIEFSSASLNGPYSFKLTGDDSSGFFEGVGSFQADGNGSITNGIQDLNHGSGYMNNMAFTGTYTVGPDGRGTMTLTNPVGATTLQFALFSNSRGRFIVYDANANGEGLLLKRDPSAFSTATLTGSYAFGLDGLGANGFVASSVGRFTADGAGHLTAGEVDTNEEGTVTSEPLTAGSYSVDVNGRGEATFTTASGDTHYAFHVVSNDTLLFAGEDFTDPVTLPVMVGTGQKQDSSSFPSALARGDFTFLLSGLSTMGSTAAAGKFATGGGSIDSGSFDQNDAGTVTQMIPLTGSNSVTSDGRGTATLTSSLGAFDYVFYMVSADEAFIMEADSAGVASGTLLGQTGGPFSNSSASGGFGFIRFAPDPDTDRLGRMIFDGAGNITGTQDVNDFGALTSDDPLTGTYAISSAGRGTATVTTSSGTASLVFYLASGSRFFVIGVDPGSDASYGNIEKQY
jgi:Bacterial Ig-like domain (group 2)